MKKIKIWKNQEQIYLHLCIWDDVCIFLYKKRKEVLVLLTFTTNQIYRLESLIQANILKSL